MIEQGNRTQQLIYRTSYRKHKERLADIRHNITANDFLPPRNHHSAKKQSQKIRVNKDDSQSANIYTKNKLNALKYRGSSKIDDLFSTEQLRKQTKRYFDQSNEVKVQLNSEINDGDHIKFVVPSQKNPSASLNTKIKEIQKGDNNVAQTKLNSIQKSYKKFSSNSIVKDTQREVKTGKQPQLFYNLPQRNQNRVVIYKKTLVFSSMQSCMLELSLINERLLIAAYLMGLQNSTLRQLYSMKRTIEIMKECQKNYQQLCSRILIQKANNKYQFIRILPKQDETKELQQKQQEKNIKIFKIQNQFIKRNYYTLAKTDQQQKEDPKDNKQIFTFDHVQAIVDRLAVPKRYFKMRQDKPKAVSNYEKHTNSYQFSHEQLARPEKRVSIQKSKESHKSINNLKQETMKMAQKQQPKLFQSVKNKNSFQKINNKSNISAQKQKEVHQNYEEVYEYEQQFDNPSSIKQSKHCLEAAKNINNSLVSSKSKQSKIAVKKSQKMEEKNQSDVYQNEFENEAEQQYEQQFEDRNQLQSPVTKIANNSSVPVQNVEEQYQQQFAD